MNQVKEWIGTIENLSCVKRFSQCFLHKQENVLEHSGMVSLVCLQLSTLLRKEGYEIDIEKILTKSLIHDSEESVIGDVSKPSKYSSDELRKLFGVYEKTVAMKIFHDAGLEGVMGNWEGAKDGPEGKIIAFVDTLSAIMRFHNEIVMRGNKTMIELLSPTAFDALFGKLNKVCECYPNSKILKEYEEFCWDVKEQITGVKI